MDRKFILTALGYAILGMILGIYMAASQNHGQFVTHAHILLAGFVVSFIYGLCHKLWLDNNVSALSRVQYYMHQTGVAVLSLGLFMFYGGYASPQLLEPVMAVASVAILIGMILMKVLFIKSSRQTA